MAKFLIVFCVIVETFSAKQRMDPISFFLGGISDERIVGGGPTDIAEFPFMVAILLDGRPICGGSLIGPRTVLTAAHCLEHKLIHDKSHLSVRAGSSSKFWGGTVSRVSTIIKHPNYRDYQYDFDIAIIELTHDVVLPEEVAKPIELWEESVLFRAGTMATVVGWGATTEGSDGSPYLRKAKVPIISNTKCALAYTIPINERNICAGFPRGGIDTCQGDSGGPLIINNKLAGVISFGRGCARADTPGVYSFIPSYRDWIRQNAFI